jgi:diadenosine tetraphosphatase ApaH/serine/threonine PP2A family protein phosphatase
MRYAILSDVHGNGDALRAVFADMEWVSTDRGVRIDQIWCLGDVVGYGPEPSECVQRIRARTDICISGNHDWAAIGKLDLQDFSGTAAESAEWTREHLRPDERVYLKSLPQVTRVGDFTLAHGSPMNPIWEYLISPSLAAPNFAAFDTLYCVVGHTHLPTIFLQPASERVVAAAVASPVTRAQQQLAMSLPGGPSWDMMENAVRDAGDRTDWATCERLMPEAGVWVLPKGYRAIINPGSVGQPRDGDARASYLIYDSKLSGFEFRRVPYDIQATQRKIRQLGLSSQLATRLAKGL